MTKPTKIFNKNFLLLWQGRFVSLLGSQIYAIAMMFWIKQQTGSATLMGLVMMVSQLPGILVGPLAGVFVDRWSRWRIIVFSDIIRGIATISLAGFVILKPDGTEIIIISLFIVGILTSTVNAFFNPAITASIPALVPSDQLTKANSLFQMPSQLASFIGPGIGGILFRLLGAPILFLVDGITYILSAISELFIKIPEEKKEKENSGKGKINTCLNEMKDGFKFIWKNQGMRILFISFSIMQFFIAPVIVLFPFYVEDVLMTTSDWYGFLITGFAFGMIIGIAFSGYIKMSGASRSKMMIAGGIIACLTIFAFGFIKSKELALANFIICGFFNGYKDVNVSTILQQSVPDHIRGRVFSVLSTIQGGLAPLGMGLAGIITDLFDRNIPLIMIGLGMICAFFTVLVAFSRHYREYLAYEPVTEEDDTGDALEGQSMEYQVS